MCPNVTRGNAGHMLEQFSREEINCAFSERSGMRVVLPVGAVAWPLRHLKNVHLHLIVCGR